MKTIWYVPIEPLHERYSYQWYLEFPKAFAGAGHHVEVIEGQAIRDFVKVGTFLDITSTIHYKSSQMQVIAKAFDEGRVKNGDTFFFGDVEFWGIEAVRLMADMLGLNVKLTGFLHAASYTNGDAFQIAESYQRFTEVGWLAALDTVFVGSDYHKAAVFFRRLEDLRQGHLGQKIVVSGNPLFADAYPKFPEVVKRKQVCLTNRFDSEKEIWLTLNLFEAAAAQNPDWNFVITTGRKTLRSNDPNLERRARGMAADGIVEIREGLTKDEYHRTLAESMVMVSHSHEENFGYCIVEAAHYDCQPLLYHGASHVELVQSDQNFLFHTQKAALKKLEALMQYPQKVSHFAEPFFTKPMQTILDHL